MDIYARKSCIGHKAKEGYKKHHHPAGLHQSCKAQYIYRRPYIFVAGFQAVHRGIPVFSFFRFSEQLSHVHFASVHGIPGSHQAVCPTLACLDSRIPGNNAFELYSLIFLSLRV